MSLIELKNFHLTFEDKEIFKDFSLIIHEGDKIRIAGRSGNGKSTLLKILLGFQKLDAGSIYVRGQQIASKDYKDIRKLFAYVNQDVTLRPGKVRDVLEEISTFSGNTYEGGFDKDLANLFEFDLKLLHKDTEELSGGERQRLGIILAIMLKRPVFLLDEVTSALDADLKHKVVQYFNSCDETVLAISHDSEWSSLGKKVEW